MLDKKLLSILVCPVSKAPLTYVHQEAGASDGDESAREEVEELRCKVSGLAYPVRDGIPVMLESEARQLSEDEIEAL